MLFCQKFKFQQLLDITNRACIDPGKPGKVLEFYSGISQDWKVVEKGYWSWKVLEIC